VQGKPVRPTRREPTENRDTSVSVYEVAGVQVSTDLVVELIPENTAAGIAGTPALCAIEVTRE
jgi:hypothetical protein